MSRPASSCACWRNDSRTRRFRRFLSHAFRQCFLDIASPSLARSMPLFLDKTVNNLSRLLLALANTWPNASASGKRLALVNRYPGAELGAGLPFSWLGIRLSSSCRVLSDASVFVGYCGVMLCGQVSEQSGCQLRAPFRASPFEYQAPGFGCHACPEPMGSRSLQVAWLKCALHCRLTCSWSLKVEPRKVLLQELRSEASRHGQKVGGKRTWGGNFCQPSLKPVAASATMDSQEKRDPGLRLESLIRDPCNQRSPGNVVRTACEF